MPARRWTAWPFDLTPVAIAEGRALAETLFNANPRSVDYATIPTAVFALPQAALGRPVGGEGARASATRSPIYRTSFRPMFHTLTGGTARTMMKLVVDKASDRVLGCHMVGEDAAEIIQGFAVALTAGATKRVFDATVALHPTAAEEFVTMYQPAPARLSAVLSTGRTRRWHATGSPIPGAAAPCSRCRTTPTPAALAEVEEQARDATRRWSSPARRAR